NLMGRIVGREIDASGISHGFLLSGGKFTVIDYPAAVWTDAVGINRNGQVVGAYSLLDSGGLKGVTGYLLSRGVFTSISFPGAGHTQAWRINDSGQIVGRYLGVDGNFHLYLLTNGGFSTI